MAFMFAPAAAAEPLGLILNLADARRQRARTETRARAARNALSELLASRRPTR